MSLGDWQKNGWLKPHKPTRQEVADLLALAYRDLKSAKTRGLDNDWRFNIAYNAVLQSATAALVASGYNVPKGDSHHFRVIGSLAFTLELDGGMIDKLDRYRKKRGMTIYDIAGAITDAEARSILELAEEIVEQIYLWLADNYPHLIKTPP